jgi:hypothetical protein
MPALINEEIQMSRPGSRRITAALSAALMAAFIATAPAHAMRKEVKLPDCNTASAECREWRQAVEMLNSMGGGGGEATPKPRVQRPVDKNKAMQACVRYMQRVQKLSVQQAQATCAQEIGN